VRELFFWWEAYTGDPVTNRIHEKNIAAADFQSIKWGLLVFKILNSPEAVLKA
jgi:hypothetical protein